MLKITGFQDCGRTEIEFGDYLPFKFWHQAHSNQSKLYWRTGNLKSTLLEVEIDRVSGQIIGASLLLPGEVRRDFPELNLSNATRSDGYPTVDINEWPIDGIKDESNELQTFIDLNRLLITFSDSVAITGTISAGDATFGVDADGSMNWVLVSNLPREKLAELENL
jgi:hypothetical protein